MTSRSAFISACREYNGVPFLNAGRSKRGIDCVGVAICAARDAEIPGWQKVWEDPECQGYHHSRGIGFLRGKLDRLVELRLMRSLDKIDVAAGDLVLCWTGFQVDHHLVILTGPSKMIHARMRRVPRSPTGRVVETSILPDDVRKFLKGYQFEGID